MTMVLGYKFKSVILLISLMASGCASSKLPSTSSLPEATQATHPTLEASVTATRSATPTPTLQLKTSTPQPTPTFPPKLSSAEAEAKVLELLKNNGDCRLPCYLGFTPGQTSHWEFVSSWYTMGNDVYLPNEDVWLGTHPGGGGDDPWSPVRGIKAYLDVYRVVDNQHQTIYDTPLYDQYFSYYSLSSLLTNYGPPANVYVFLDLGIADMGLGIDLYLLFLDYTESGWVAMFQMPLLWKDEAKTTMVGCPHQAFTQLQLWSPGDTEMAAEYGFADGPGNSFTIEEATSLTLVDFYQQYKDSTNTQCLETPKSVFPQ